MTKPKPKPKSRLPAKVAALFDAAAGLPKPPNGVKLTAAERRHWDGIMRLRLPSDWPDTDLAQAVNLAQTLAEIQVQRREAAREGGIVINEMNGTTKVNPRYTLLDTLVRHSVQLMRLLQLHSLARNGATRDLVHRKSVARQANSVMQGDEGNDFLARPTMQ